MSLILCLILFVLFSSPSSLFLNLGIILRTSSISVIYRPLYPLSCMIQQNDVLIFNLSQYFYNTFVALIKPNQLSGQQAKG